MNMHTIHTVPGMLIAPILACVVTIQPLAAQEATPTPAPEAVERQVFQVLPLSAEVNQYCAQIIDQRRVLLPFFPGSISKLFGSLL